MTNSINKNLSATERKFEQHENQPTANAIEKQFNAVLSDIEKKLKQEVKTLDIDQEQKTALMGLVEDIQDSDGSLEVGRVDKIKLALNNKLVPKEVKEQIAWLYGYATEIDDLNGSYKTELGQLVTGVADEISRLFKNFPRKNATKFSSKFNEIIPEITKLDDKALATEITEISTSLMMTINTDAEKRNVAIQEFQNLTNSLDPKSPQAIQNNGILNNLKKTNSDLFSSKALKETRTTAKIVSDRLQREIDEEKNPQQKGSKIKKLNDFTATLSNASDIYKQNSDFIKNARIVVEKYEEIDAGLGEMNMLKKDPSWRKIFGAIKKTYDIDAKDFSILARAAKSANLTDIFSIVDQTGATAFDKKFPEGYNKTGKSGGLFKTELGIARAAAKVYEKYSKDNDTKANENIKKFLNQVKPILENNDVTDVKVLWEQIARLTTITNSAENLTTDKKLAYMLGDIDANGKVNKEDGATIAGLALSNMYENAKAQLSEAEVVQNILAFMNMGKTEGNVIKPTGNTETDFTDYLISHPAELQSLRNKLFLMGDEAILIFKRGKKTGEIATQRYIDKEVFSDAINKEKEINKLIDEKMGEGYSRLLADLQKLAKDPTTQPVEAKKYQELINDLNNNKAANLKNIKLEAIGIGAMFLKDKYIGSGVGAMIGSEKFNAWLSENTKDLLQNLSFVPGIAHSQDNKIGVALGLNLGGGKQWGDIMKHGDRSASWNFGLMTNVGPTFTFGVGGRYGREWQVNANQIRENFEQTTAKYINAGISAYYSVDGAHVAGDIGYRRDQLRGIEQKGDVIRADVDLQELIQTVLRLGATKAEVIKSLKEVFPKTKDTAGMEAFAQKILNAIAVFTGVDRITQVDVSSKVAKSIAENLARTYKNEQVQGMAKVQFTGVHMVVDFPVRPGAPVDLAIETVLLSVFSSVGITKYSNTKWLEDLESVQQASDILASGAGLDKNSEIGSRSEKTAVDNLNKIAKAIERKETTDPVWFSNKDINGTPYILIEKIAFEKMNFAIAPALKQYVGIHGGKVAIPAVPSVYTEFAKSNSMIRTLVFGSFGTGNTEQLILSDIPGSLPEKEFDKSILVTPHAVAETIKYLQGDGQLLAPLRGKIEINEKDGSVKIKDTIEWVKFDGLKGVLKFSELNGVVSVKLDTNGSLATEPLKIEYFVQKIMNVELGKPDSEWQSYLDNPAVEAKIIQLKNHGGTPAQKTAYIQYKTAKQSNKPDEAIAAVKKMGFDPTNLENQTDKNITIANLNYLSGKFALTSATWSKDVTSDNFDKYINTENNKLRGTLSRERQQKLRDVPLETLTTARREGRTYEGLGVNSLQKLIKKEQYLSSGKASFENARNTTVSMIGKDALYGSKESKNAIALVFGYGTTGVEENFTGHPKLATKKESGALYETPVTDANLKRYFLENMNTKTNYFDQLAIAIAEQYNQGLTAENRVNVKDITPDLIKNALLAETDEGRIIIIGDKKIPIGAEFSFAFYAECFNESLVMKNLTVKKETRSDVKLEDKVYENLANTMQKASRDQFAVIGGVGTSITKKADVGSGTNTNNINNKDGTLTGNADKPINPNADDLDNPVIVETPPINNKPEDLTNPSGTPTYDPKKEIPIGTVGMVETSIVQNNERANKQK